MPFVVTSFCLQSTQSKQNRSSKPVPITYIGFFACFHSIFFTCSGFRKGLHSSEAVIACSARIADDNQTDTPSTVTLAEHNYAPGVNLYLHLIVTLIWINILCRALKIKNKKYNSEVHYTYGFHNLS